MKNTQKGITLIALIITIIVMLILVGVSVSVALNTGLFKAAQGAAKNTEAHKINETAISNGMITLEGIGTDSVQNIVNSYKEGTTGGDSIPEGAINLTNENGGAQYIMQIGDVNYIIDEQTTIEQFNGASENDFTHGAGNLWVSVDGNYYSIYAWETYGTDQVQYLPMEENYNYLELTICCHGRIPGTWYVCTEGSYDSLDALQLAAVQTIVFTPLP